MIKRLYYEDRDLLKEVVKTRTKLMLMESAALADDAIFLNSQASFDSNVYFGHFTEDGLLDAFIFVNVWSEMPAYSCVVYTRKRDGRERNEYGVDSNLSDLWDYTVYYMGQKLNLWQHFQVTAAGGIWKPSGPRIEEKSLIDVVETIQAGTLSKYATFRAHLLNRTVEKDVQIKRYVMKPEMRF